MSRLLKSVLSLNEWLLSILIFVMMLLTVVDVIGRYIFNAPVFGAAEMIQFLLAISIFSGMVLVSARDKHIAVELFEASIKARLGKVQPLLVHVFSITTMAVMCWSLSEYALEAWEQNAETVVLEWPLAIVCAIVAALALVSLALQVLVALKPKGSILEYYPGDK